MKVPGIEEICRTFGDTAYIAHKWDGIPELSQSMYRAGLLAVFETHVGPMIDAAVAFGLKLDDGQEACEIVEARRLYRERIIAQLKEPRHD